MRRGLTGLAYLFALGLALTACGLLPKPFQPEVRTPNDLLVLKDRGGILVAPLDGDLPADPDLLVRAIAQRLQDLNVPATTQGVNGETRVLQGRAQQPPRSDAPAEVVVSWELWNLEGLLVGAYTQRQTLGLAPDPGGRDLIAALAGDAAPKIAALMQDPAEREARVPGFPGARLVIAPLAGGPGDSVQSLPTALRTVLAAAGLPVAERAQPDDILIQGRVEVEPAGPGLENVMIQWSVTGGPDRADLGQVEQRNQVPAGSLDGRWGPVAGFVAQGAVDGLIDLLNRVAAP